ncbi:YfhO family protein [Thermoactinomyces sp. DSM 45892]|uniref:YfhO family protein n=1 Tax=Thermoactinomyces sp. DSM 45892 TaxID=1882753 RepID=UPI000898FECC|nr:YfhO family protein [Thermoactinomyces sp. DSM 45892]SDY13901.1 Uncharacterized membrane protein YfhO [Thermoactinomyces sp. DSM 45892]
MKRNQKKWKGILGVYFFFLLISIGLHGYFLYYNVDFTEACCDSRKQIAHFFPFLNQEYSQGNFMWSWNNGLGGDMFSEFIYYFATSPFFWLTMPLDIATIQDAFQVRIFISLFKVTLAMIFMYHLLRYNKRTKFSSIVGSLIYCGSLYLMWNSLRFDFMADGLVWLPLLILGFERMIDQQKKGMFVGLVFLIVSSNFYLAFGSTVFLYLYAALKYFLSRDTYRFVDFIKYYLQITGWYIVGLLLSAFSFLTVISAYLQVDRFYPNNIPIPILFDWSFYQKLLYQLFLFPKQTEFTIVLPVIVLLLIFYGFFIKEKQIRQRMIFTIFFFILLLVPFTYTFFNGMVGIQYRWLYLFLFVMAQTTAFVLDHLLEKPHRKARLYFIGMAALLIIMVICKPYVYALEKEPYNSYSRQEFVIGVLGLLSIVCFLLINKLSRKVITTLLVGLLTLNILFTNWMLFEFHNYPPKLKKEQQAYLKVYNQPEDVEMFKELEKEDPTFFRTMWEGMPEFNAPMVYRYRGFGTYNSLLSGTVHKFFKNDYNTRQYNTPSVFTNLDNRLYLETALGNKYYVVSKDRSMDAYFEDFFPTDPLWKSWKPYGYTLMKETKKFKIYRNDFALPIGFLYDSVVDRQTFEKLNFAQRDQLLLNAVVVDDHSKVNLPVFETNQLDVQAKVISNVDIVTRTQGFSLTNATLVGNVLKADVGATLTIPNPFSKKLGETLVEMEIKRKDPERFRMWANGKMFWDFGQDNMYNYPKEKVVLNTGYDQKDLITITFNEGTYELNKLSLQFDSLEPYPDLVKQKREQSLQNVSFDSTHVKGDIKADKEGILYLSIPYSKGWKAKVDGKEVETMKVNSTFVGVPITKGEHKVELSYFTPNLLVGTGISFVTLLSLIGYFWWERKRRNRYQVGDSENT